MEYILSSERLGFRKLSLEDFEDLCIFLQDMDVMYAWEHAFSDDEVSEWIHMNLMRYEAEGFSYFAVIKKDTCELIGAMGPLLEDMGGVKHMGIAYILDKKYWSKGYGIEGARACMNYAFEDLGAEKVIAEIRPGNAASRKVAEKLGMEIEGEYDKSYKGRKLTHLIYSRAK